MAGRRGAQDGGDGGAYPPGGCDTRGAARPALLVVCEALEGSRELRAEYRAVLLGVLDGRRQVSLCADTGIFPNTGFFTESFRRVSETILPDAPDPEVLRDVIGEIFHRPDDALWVDEVGLETWTRFLRVLRFDEAGPEVSESLVHTLRQMMESLRVISYRISSIGLEEEVLRIDPSLEKFGSPFLAQNVETIAYLDAYENRLSDPAAPVHDEKHLLVLFSQCDAVVDRIRSRSGRSGTSFSLTFLLTRLEQNLGRANALLGILAAVQAPGDDGEIHPELLPRVAALANELVRAECRKNDLPDYLRRMTRLMSLRITENAGRTGEHYITASRAEYFDLLKA